MGPGQVDLPGRAPAWLSAYPLSSHFLSQPPSSVHNESPAPASSDCHSKAYFLFKNFEKENYRVLKGVLVIRRVWRYQAVNAERWQKYFLGYSYGPKWQLESTSPASGQVSKAPP